MSSGQDIQDIIARLQRLQLEQSELLLRLARATGERDRNNTTGNVVPSDPVREFAIGNRVRIKNPGRFQASSGIITRIGTTRITVEPRNGTKIVRAPKNLAHEDA
jgi:hypothetical protein